MQTHEAIRARHSCRDFSSKSISKDTIGRLIDAGRLAPTARNIQPWEFVAITEANKLKEIGALAENGHFISGCPCCIAVLCKETKYYLEDGCAATENILLMAADMGLASCWVAGDKKPYCDAVKKIIGAAQDYNLVALIALGYSRGPLVNAAAKRPLAEVLHWENF